MVWNHPKNNNDIFSLTFCVYVIARLYGLWPFSVNFNQKLKTSTVYLNAFDWLWFVVAILIHLLWFLVYWHTSGHRDSFIAYLLARSMDILSIVYWLLTLVLDLINRKRIWGIIGSFDEFDKEVYISKYLQPNCFVSKRKSFNFRCSPWAAISASNSIGDALLDSFWRAQFCCF